MDLKFHRDLLDRARQDYPDLDSLQKLRDWFSEFVDLYEEELSSLMDGDRPAPPAAQPNGRKKSMVFNMLSGGGISGSSGRLGSSSGRLGSSGRLSLTRSGRGSRVLDQDEESPFTFGRGRRSSSTGVVAMPPRATAARSNPFVADGAIAAAPIAQSPESVFDTALNSPTHSMTGKKKPSGRVKFGSEEGVAPAVNNSTDDSLKAAISPHNQSESPPFLNPGFAVGIHQEGVVSPDRASTQSITSPDEAFGNDAMKSYTAFGDAQPLEQEPEEHVAVDNAFEEGAANQSSKDPVISFVPSHAFGTPRGSTDQSSDADAKPTSDAKNARMLRNPSIKFMNSMNSEDGASSNGGDNANDDANAASLKLVKSISMKNTSGFHPGTGSVNEDHGTMHKTETMGARLLQKLGKKASFAPHSSHTGSEHVAVRASADPVLFASPQDSVSSNPQSLVPPPIAVPTKSPAALNVADVETLEAQSHNLDHIMSTLELKALLTQPQYFTKEQIEKERFHRVSSFIDKLVTDWSILMIFFTAFTVAARLGLQSSRISSNLVWVELTVDVINFILVIGINMFKPFEEAGHIRTDVRLIVERYLKQPQLAVFDLISNFPLLVIFCAMGNSSFEYARLNLILREARLPKLIEILEAQLPATLHPSLLRLLSYFMYLILIITHLATVYMITLRLEPEQDVEAWVDLSLHSQLDHDPWFWFSRCWRDMLALITEKHLLYPHEDAEYIVGIILVILSLMTLAVILASFEEIIVTEIEEGNVLGKKIDATLAVLETMGIEGDLQLEIVEYYQNMWDVNRSFDFHSDDMLAELPDMLHDDIEFECNARIIRSIPLFTDVAQNPDFVRLLAGELQQIVVMPGAPIVQKGEDGDCMFFVSSGVASVMDEAGVEEVSQLVRGSFFGEVTLLFGGQRDRTINAKTLCVCYVVTDEQFENIVEVYPEALDAILESAVRQMKASAHAVDDPSQGDGTEPPRARSLGGTAVDASEQPVMAQSSFAFGFTIEAPTTDDKHGTSTVQDEEMTEDEIRAMMAKRMKFGSVSARRHRGAMSLTEGVVDEEEGTRKESAAAGRFVGAGLQFVFGEESPPTSARTNTLSPATAQLPTSRRGRSKSIGYSLVEACLQSPSSKAKDDES